METVVLVEDGNCFVVDGGAGRENSGSLEYLGSLSFTVSTLIVFSYLASSELLR